MRLAEKRKALGLLFALLTLNFLLSETIHADIPRAFSKDRNCFESVYRHHDFSEYEKYLRTLSDEALTKALDSQAALDLCLLEYSRKPEDKTTIGALGAAYYYNSDFENALRYLNKAERNGDWYAALILMEMYWFGEGVEIDLSQAHRYVSLSLTYESNPWAHFFAGKNYLNGWGVEPDKKTAYEHFKIAANQNNSRARVYLANQFLNENDPSEAEVSLAVNLLVEEIEKGNPAAKVQYAVIQIENPESKLDFFSGMSMLKSIAGDTSDEASRYFIGYNLAPEEIKRLKEINPTFKPDFVAAKSTLTELIQTGDDGGLFYVDELFEWEIASNLTDEDAEKVKKALERRLNDEIADGAGSNLIVTLLGILIDAYEYGYFGPPDKAKARMYSKQAIANGSEFHAVNLGWQLFLEANPEEFEEAVAITQSVTSSADTHLRLVAFNNLGAMYASQNDYETAENYWLKASKINFADGFGYSWPFENLARLYIFGTKSKKPNPDLALKYAKAASDFKDRDYFLQILRKNSLSEDTKHDEIVGWFEAHAIEENFNALWDIADQAEIFGNDVEAVKWHQLCLALCDQRNSEDSSKKLDKLASGMRGVSFARGVDLARRWKEQNLRSLLSQRQIATPKLSDLSSSSEPALEMAGRFFALLIGVSDYTELTSLASPIRDARAIGSILETKYAFTVEYLENPKREEITKALNDYRKKVTEEDHLLIFFAGHGVTEDDEGFWLPVDAAKYDDSNWVSHSFIKRKIAQINATNILILADSCFQEPLTRGVSLETSKRLESTLEKFLRTKSRVVITSGGDEPVIDSIGSQGSVFAQSLVETLSDRNTPFTALELYQTLRKQVSDRTVGSSYDQTPFFGEIRQSGHKGPDFVFLPQ